MNIPPCKIPIVRFCLVAIAMASASCDNNEATAAWWQGENERISLEQQLELKKFKFERVYSSDTPALERLNAANAASNARLAELAERRTRLTGELEAMEAGWSDFKLQVIADQRRNALGMTFETLGLASGKDFEAVKVTAIDDAGVSIRHSAGSARLRYSDLDEGQRRMFGLEADLAFAAERREKADSAAYERWIDAQLLVAQAKEETERQLVAAENRQTEQRKERLHAQAAARNLLAANSRPLGQKATSFGNGYSGSRYVTRRPTYRYVYHQRPTYIYHGCRPRVPFPCRVYERPRSFYDTTP